MSMCLKFEVRLSQRERLVLSAYLLRPLRHCLPISRQQGRLVYLELRWQGPEPGRHIL